MIRRALTAFFLTGILASGVAAEIATRAQLLADDLYPETLIATLIFLSTAEAKNNLASCLTDQYFASPEAVTGATKRLYSRNTQPFAHAIHHEIIAPCLTQPRSFSHQALPAFIPLGSSVAPPLFADERIPAALTGAALYAHTIQNDMPMARCIALHLVTENDSDAIRRAIALHPDRPVIETITEAMRTRCLFLRGTTSRLRLADLDLPDLRQYAARRLIATLPLDLCTDDAAVLDHDCLTLPRRVLFGARHRNTEPRP